jgi:hypothetical protein
VASCAAQNAALGLLFLRTQVAGVERLARGALVDTGSLTAGFDDNLALSKCANHRSLSRLPSRRQPFRIRSLEARWEDGRENAPVHLQNAIRI